MSYAWLRWLLLALAGVLVGYVVVRRRQQLVEALPQPLVEQAERFVIPWPTPDPPGDAPTGALTPAGDDTGSSAGAEEVEEAETADSRRKVSATHRISYGGRRYGPLPAALVGQYVDIENSNGKLFVLHDGTPIATFDLPAD